MRSSRSLSSALCLLLAALAAAPSAGADHVCDPAEPAWSCSHGSIVRVEPGVGGWGEPCVRIQVHDGATYHQGTCAGKGVIVSGERDCVLWVNSHAMGHWILQDQCFPLPLP